MKLPSGIKNLLKIVLGLSVGIAIGWIFTSILELLYDFINLQEWI